MSRKGIVKRKPNTKWLEVWPQTEMLCWKEAGEKLERVAVDRETCTSEKKFNHSRNNVRFANIFLGSNFILFLCLFFSKDRF